jgi:Tol biopolymer transport system component
MRRLLLALMLLTVSAQAENNHDINNISRREGGLASKTGDSSNPSISGDGNFVVYSSTADDLVPSDQDTFTDVFLVNRQTPTPIPVRISADRLGGDSNGNNDQPNISNDGNVIVFRSAATDLVLGPSFLGTPQVYLYNRIATPTPRATPIGTVGPFALISTSDSGTGGSAASFSPKASDNGNFVVFASLAKNLVSPCVSGSDSQIFLFDASQSSPLTCISKVGGGSQGNDDSYAPAISRDGSLIVYESTATNLVGFSTGGKKNIYLYDQGSGTTTLVSSNIGSGAADGDSSNPVISADGTYIAFDTNSTDIVTNCPSTSEQRAVVLYKVADGTKTCASVKPNGTVCDGTSIHPAVNGDGSILAYLSDCIDLVVPEAKTTPGTGVYDVYRYVVGTPTISRENSTVGQAQATPAADHPVINDDGSIIAFDTAAKLRPNDINGLIDVYVTDQNCNTDSDGDGTADCDEECFLDPTKLTGGTCGCGVGEADTDGDSVLDCLDGCSNDPNKIASGACGCGVVDTDADANTIADCLEPTSTTTPPVLTFTKKFAERQAVLTTVPSYKNRGYLFTYRLYDRNKKLLQSITTTKNKVTFSRLNRGTYYARYRFKTGLGQTTKYSQYQRLRFVK